MFMELVEPVEPDTDEEDPVPFYDAQEPEEPEEPEPELATPQQPKPELRTPRQPLESVESVDSPGTHTLPHTVSTRSAYQIISHDRCRNQQSWQLRARINCSKGVLLVNTTMSAASSRTLFEDALGGRLEDIMFMELVEPVEPDTDEEDPVPFYDAQEPEEPEPELATPQQLEPELRTPRQPWESVESVDSPGTHTLPHTVSTRSAYQIISHDRCRNQQSWQLRARINCSKGVLLVNTTMSAASSRTLFEDALGGRLEDIMFMELVEPVEPDTDEEDPVPFYDAQEPEEPEEPEPELATPQQPEPELRTPRQPLESVVSVDSPGTHTLPHTVSARSAYQIISTPNKSRYLTLTSN